MGWRALHPSHSIERVRIVISFSTQLPIKLLRRLAAENETRRVEFGFTSKNLREGHQIQVGAEGIRLGQSQAELLGWEWRKLSPANTVIEALVLEQNALVYETIEYSRWREFADRFNEVTSDIMRDVVNVVDVTTVSLEYIDRFVFEGVDTAAKPDELIQNIKGILHPDAESGQELWHFHRGWYENFEPQKLLITQNIDAQNGTMPKGGTVRSIQILTKTELRQIPLEFDCAGLSPYLENMHNRSKEVFRSALCKRMHDVIGLTKDNDE